MKIKSNEYAMFNIIKKNEYLNHIKKKKTQNNKNENLLQVICYLNLDTLFQITMILGVKKKYFKY